MERKLSRKMIWFMSVVGVLTTASMGYFLYKYWSTGVLVLRENLLGWAVLFGFGLLLTNVFSAYNTRLCLKLGRENNELSKDICRLLDHIDRRVFKVENTVNSLSVGTQAIIRNLIGESHE